MQSSSEQEQQQQQHMDDVGERNASYKTAAEMKLRRREVVTRQQASEREKSRAGELTQSQHRERRSRRGSGALQEWRRASAANCGNRGREMQGGVGF